MATTTLSAPTSPSHKRLGLSSSAADFDNGFGMGLPSRRRSKKERLAALLTGGSSKRHGSSQGKHQSTSLATTPVEAAANLPALGGRHAEAEMSPSTKRSSLPRFGRSNTDSQLQQWTDPVVHVAQQQSILANDRALAASPDDSAAGTSSSATATAAAGWKAGADHNPLTANRSTDSERQGESKPRLGARMKLRRRSSNSKALSEKQKEKHAVVVVANQEAALERESTSSGVVDRNPPKLPGGRSTPDLPQREYLSNISLNSNESKASAVIEHARMRLLADTQAQQQQRTLTSEGGFPGKGLKTSAASRIRRSLRFRRNTVSGRIKSPSSQPDKSPSPQRSQELVAKAKGVAVIPGSFRRVSGICDQKIVTPEEAVHPSHGVNSAPGSRSNSSTAFERVVSIRRDSGKPFGFKFIFELPRKTRSTGDAETDGWDQQPCAYVTHVERNTLIDTHHLLEVGDRIMTINGVSVASARRAQDLREMVQTFEQLVMTVRSSYDTAATTTSNISHMYTLPKSRPVKSHPKNPVEYEYTPQPRARTGPTYMPGEQARIGMNPNVMSQLSAAVARRPQSDRNGVDAEMSGNPHGGDVGSEAEIASTHPQVLATHAEETNNEKTSPNIERPLLVECMDAILEDKTLSCDAKQEAIAKQLGAQLDLPFLSEPVTCVGFSDNDLDEDDYTPSDPVKARNVTGKIAQSVLSLLSNDDDSEIFAEVTGDPILSEQACGSADDGKTSPDSSVLPVDGFMLVRLLDGCGFASKGSSHLYCVLDIGGNNTAAKSSSLQAAGANTVCWDEDFDIDLECTRQLVISVYAMAPGKDVLRAQTALHLRPLFSSARLRRLRLLLPTGGILRLKLAYADRAALLQRLPSASQFGTFGIGLAHVVQRERVTVPLIVQKCIYEIDRRGLRHVGLYRVNGSSKKKRALRQSVEANSRTAMLSEEHIPDINVIVGLLKEYLRELPEPLLTHALYSDLIQAVKPSKDRDGPEEDVRRKRLYSVLARLPQAEMDTCRMLFAHLARVLENSSHNQMTAHNLAICLGPVLMMPSPQSPKKVPQQVAQDFNAQIGVIFHILVFGWPEYSS